MPLPSISADQITPPLRGSRRPRGGGGPRAQLKTALTALARRSLCPMRSGYSLFRNGLCRVESSGWARPDRLYRGRCQAFWHDVQCGRQCRRIFIRYHWRLRPLASAHPLQSGPSWASGGPRPHHLLATRSRRSAPEVVDRDRSGARGRRPQDPLDLSPNRGRPSL